MPLSDPISATRVLCGALILPTIATIVGKLMFGSVQSNFQRTLLVCQSPTQLSTRGFLFNQSYGVDDLILHARPAVKVQGKTGFSKSQPKVSFTVHNMFNMYFGRKVRGGDWQIQMSEGWNLKGRSPVRKWNMQSWPTLRYWYLKGVLLRIFSRGDRNFSIHGTPSQDSQATEWCTRLCPAKLIKVHN